MNLEPLFRVRGVGKMSGRVVAASILMVAILAGCRESGHQEAMRVKSLRVNGVDLAFVEEGRGETVLFVHGAAGDWRSWESVRPYISDAHHYVSISRRYHVPNAWPDGGEHYSIDQNIEDVAGFIRALHVGKVHLVGHSYGGRIAGGLALRYPELVRSVVLGDPGLVSPDSPEGQKAVAEWQSDRERVNAEVEKGDAARAAIELFNAVMDDSGAFSAAPSDQRRRWLDNARTVIALFRGPASKPVTCDELQRLKVPALVLGGEFSRAYYRLGNDRLMACLPEGTEQAIIPNAGHFFAQTDPEQTAQAILAFVAKH